MKSDDNRALIEGIINIGRDAESKGLIWANSGNISHRLDERTFIITGSGSHLGKLSENDLGIFDLEKQNMEGQAEPSIETRMHSGIYKVREDVNTVFHSQAFFTTLISCTSLEVDSKLFPESMAYIEKVGRVRYHHPGSIELANAVSEKIKDCDALILTNHGAICAEENLEKVLLKTETLEFLCRLIAISHVSDYELNFLSEEIRNDFLEHLKSMK
jgi:L-fuculose-phosphate aldolase